MDTRLIRRGIRYPDACINDEQRQDLKSYEHIVGISFGSVDVFVRFNLLHDMKYVPVRSGNSNRRVRLALDQLPVDDVGARAAV